MLISLKSPGIYMQKKDAIKELYTYVSPFGSSALILISPSGYKRHSEDIRNGLNKDGFQCEFRQIGGECCQQNIDAIIESICDHAPSMIISVGGGKILDTGKSVADALNLSCINIPTVASTDAPCSALAVLYTPEGIFDKYIHPKRCPDVVLVDTRIIADAPSKYLSFGIGDALSTYFEARAVKASGSPNQLGTQPTAAAFALAKGCYETLMEYGKQAYEDAKKHEVSFALERVVEANTYLSGVGFESGGVACAHALQKGVTVIPKLHKKAHGEIVAFNTIVQLCLEKIPEAELRMIIEFCRSVDLPTKFEDLCDEPITRQEWMAAAEFTCRPGMTIHKMPFEVTPQQLVDAIYEADRISSAIK